MLTISVLSFTLLCNILKINGETISITQHPANDTSCVGSNAVLSCVIFDNTTNNATDNTAWFLNTNPPATLSSNMISNTRVGDVVTSVLTIKSVSLNDNNTKYFCSPSFGIASYVGVISVAGPPEDVSHTIKIPLDTVTACGFVVQWNNASSDSVCGTVWYTVTITTVGGMIVNTNSTRLTHYNVTKLSDDKEYCVTVIASNIAGSRSSAPTMMTTNKLTPDADANRLNDTALNVTWSPSYSGYRYLVTWSDRITDVGDNYTVSGNINSHTVTGLNNYATYIISVTAMGECGEKISNLVTVADFNDDINSVVIVDDNDDRDDDNDDDDGGGGDIVIIVVVVVVVVAGVGGAVGVTTMGIVAYKKRSKAKGTVTVSNKENEYAETNKTSDIPQEKDSLHYDYAMNGPRGVVLPSRTSGMPQNQ